MDLCLTLDHRFLQTPDNRIWTVTQCPYSFYSEYLEVFDRVRVIGRTFPVPKREPNFMSVTGPSVEFYPMAAYQGPIQFLARYHTVKRSVQNAVPNNSAVILRVPSQVANSVEKSIRTRRHPYGLDVVADPYDVLSPAANPHPLAPIARMTFTYHLKQQARRAVAVRYVTQSYLQRRYPPHEGAVVAPSAATGLSLDQERNLGRQYVVAVSDVNLPEEWFLDQPREGLREPGVIHALFIGTLGSLYKGPDTLIRATAVARSAGVRVLVRFAGSGKQIETLKALASELNVSEQITFLGDVQSGAHIRDEIDSADVFVLPSRAEGVPRAMLEAMARSAPCLGSDAGGIPELLHEDDRIPPGDFVALGAKFSTMAQNPSLVKRMSIRNYQTSRTYATESLQKQRLGFLLAVRERTEDRMKSSRRTLIALQTSS